MNNIFSKIKTISFMAIAFTFASCDDICNEIFGDYLDKLPDDRIELNSVENIKKALVFAYPENTITYLTEFSSDNVVDNGKSYNYEADQDKIYRFMPVTETDNDDPKSVWDGHYRCVATVNEVLAAIDKIGLNEETKPLRAEALLCRAYSIFSLANCFCMAYNDTTANKYLGIPYTKEIEKIMEKRGTLAETYANIDADIEEALTLLDDSYLKVPAYHFNKRAAYAFAARFNLYYQKWEKAKNYAEIALGDNPTSIMRTKISTYAEMEYNEVKNAYIESGDPCNFLIVSKISTMGRAKSNYRYAHNRELCTSETLWADAPWDYNDEATLYESELTYGNTQSIYTPNVSEFFETTDQMNKTGYAHIMDVPFTADETNLVHAEACIALCDTLTALRDLNYFVQVHCNSNATALTFKNLKDFWKGMPTYSFSVEKRNVTMSPKKIFHAPFKLSSNKYTKGTQEDLIYTLLQMRRIETLWKGMRFQDIKRYGIEFVHNLDGEAPIVFKTGDLRGAIQLPQEVIHAKVCPLEANPR